MQQQVGVIHRRHWASGFGRGDFADVHIADVFAPHFQVLGVVDQGGITTALGGLAEGAGSR
jgi:hypothetical protein